MKPIIERDKNDLDGMIEEQNLEAMKISKIWNSRKKNFLFFMPFFGKQNNTKKIYKLSKRFDSQYRRMILTPIKYPEEKKYQSFSQYVDSLNDEIKKKKSILIENSSIEKVNFDSKNLKNNNFFNFIFGKSI